MTTITTPLTSVRDRDEIAGQAVSRNGRLATLTPALILAWADAHHGRTGAWPSSTSGPVGDAPGETWSGLNTALRLGTRGLPGGDSVHRLLRREGRIAESRGRPAQVSRHLLVYHLSAEGLSLAEIGRRLGVSRQAAWEMLRRTSQSGTRGNKGDPHDLTLAQ